MSKKYSYINFNRNISVCSLTPPSNIVNTYADSGATNTYFRLKDDTKYKVDTKNSIVVTQSNGDTMQSTQMANTNLPTLPSAAKIGHVIPNLLSASFLSIGQLCDDNCLALFTKEKVFIFKQNKLLLQGKRNHYDSIRTIPVSIQSVSIPSPNFTTKSLLQHTNDNFKLKLNFQRLFRKLKTTFQVHNVVQNTKYQDISKAVNKLKYLLQHIHNIKLISEQVN